MALFSTYDFIGEGLLFAVVVSGIITAVGWVVARRKQHRLEALAAEMEAEDQAAAAENAAAHDRARQQRAQQAASER